VQNKKRHKDRGSGLGFGLVLVLALIQALAHPEPATAQTSEVTVTGSRDADVQPIMQIDPEDLQSYGTSSVQDLLDALGPRIQSSMSDSPPVILINGRLAGATELKNLPPEAIARVDVLPEKAALRYGFPDDRRVVNLILREHFRAYVVEASDSQSTDDGACRG
jgi:iron complex outermembrane recepter protein